MIKNILIAVALMLTLGVSISNAACPPGYITGNPTIYARPYQPNCIITVEWCYTLNSYNEIAGIFINTVSTTGDCDFTPPNNTISVEEMIAEIALDNFALFGVTGIMDFSPCGQITTGGDIKVNVFMGACYENLGTSQNPYYVICNNDNWGQCKEYYQICRIYVNGVWKLTSVGMGVPSAFFNCQETQCSPLCQ